MPHSPPRTSLPASSITRNRERERERMLAHFQCWTFNGFRQVQLERLVQRRARLVTK